MTQGQPTLRRAASILRERKREGRRKAIFEAVDALSDWHLEELALALEDCGESYASLPSAVEFVLGRAEQLEEADKARTMIRRYTRPHRPSPRP